MLDSALIIPPCWSRYRIIGQLMRPDDRENRFLIILAKVMEKRQNDGVISHGICHGQGRASLIRVGRLGMRCHDAPAR